MNAQRPSAPKFKRIAVVLGGGGAKGAYHVGVQKALAEEGYVDFTSIAGTSVGALNAILFATVSPSISSAVWMQMADFTRQNKGGKGFFIAWGFLIALLLFPIALLGWVVLSAIYSDLRVTSPVFYLGMFVACSGCRTMFLEAQELVINHLLEMPEILVNLVVIACGLGAAVPAMSFVFDWEMAPPQQGFLDICWRAIIVMIVWVLSIWAWHLYKRFWRAQYKRALSTSLLDRSLLETLVQQRIDDLVAKSEGTKVVAAVSRYCVYYDPQGVGLIHGGGGAYSAGVGGWSSGWVPSYMHLDHASLDLTRSILLESAALPFAFPNTSDDKESYCDGGLTDNLPIAPILAGPPLDLVFVVPLGQMTKEERSEKAMFQAMDEKWALYLKSHLTYSSDSDDGSRKSLLREADSSPDKNRKYSSVFEKTKPSRQMGKTVICVIEPSEPLSTSSFPILSFFTGTLNFSKPAFERWMSLGEQDARRCLKNLGQGVL